MKFEEVDFNNANLAIEVQKNIFPNEDGILNILASLDRNLFMELTDLSYPDDGVKYYLAYVDGKVVGITGLYNYLEHPEEAWLAWFGVIPEYRGLGYATKILEWSIEKSKENGKKVVRLYTDLEENKEAIKLYEKMGFKGEKYLSEILSYNCYIYSKSITQGNYPWRERNLELGEQCDFETASPEFKEKIYNIYKEEYLDL